MWGPRGNMPSWMGGPCPDDMWGHRGNRPPWMGGPCPDDMWQCRENPTENMFSGPNAPNRRGPENSFMKKQPKYLCGTNSRENGPLPSGSCSSDQAASGNAAENSADTQGDSTEEGAARILANFGLSAKDLEEFRHYSDDQLKPENMAVILRDIVERKKTRQLPTTSQGKEEENSGEHDESDSLRKTGPVVPSEAQPATTPAASLLPQSSVSPPPSMRNDSSAVLPTVFPHVCSLCKIECATMTAWNLHVGTPAHTEKCDQLRQDHEADKKKNHIPVTCSTSSSLKGSQCSSLDHAQSQTWSGSRSPGPPSRKRSRSRSPGSRSSEGESSSTSSSQSPSRQKRELERSTKSPASSAEAGSSSQPPAVSDVAEQPPNKPDHPLQTDPGHQEPPKEEAATQGQGDQQREELVATQVVEAALASENPNSDMNPAIPRKKRSRSRRKRSQGVGPQKVTWGMLKTLSYDAQHLLQRQGIKEEPETFLAAVITQLNMNSQSL